MYVGIAFSHEEKENTSDLTGEVIQRLAKEHGFHMVDENIGVTSLILYTDISCDGLRICKEVKVTNSDVVVLIGGAVVKDSNFPKKCNSEKVLKCILTMLKEMPICIGFSMEVDLPTYNGRCNCTPG
jgi:hypothetical protein